MTPEQYRASLDRLGLTQVGAARLLRVDDRTSRRWAADGPIPGSVAVLLRIMEVYGLTAEDVERMIAT